MRVYRATVEYSHSEPSNQAKCQPYEFDSEDLEVITKHLHAARETCEPWERHAIDRLIRVIETA